MNDRKDELEQEERELLSTLRLDALPVRSVKCPSPEMLLASKSGVLPEATSRRVAEHMAGCIYCTALARDLADDEIAAPTREEEERIRERVFHTVPKSAKAPRTGRVLWVWFRPAFAVTALALVLVLAAVWVGSRHQVSPTRPSPVAVQVPQRGAPSVFQLEKLPIKLEASSVLIWRGQPRTAQEKYAAQLALALALYRDGNYEEAVRRLTQVTQDYPHGAEGHLYLGVSHLFLKRNLQAIRSLRAAEQSGSKLFADDATWYLALAYQRGGEDQLALAELQKLCQGNGVYARRACEGIQELSGRSGGSSRR